ncbi:MULTISPECIES: hypothetical protein [unclassified Microbacterium]|uniref:hypothetical protein n=1 Tax=unclassified Microbacterium TaxID=2609290 RepID=UPI003016D3C7
MDRFPGYAQRSAGPSRPLFWTGVSAGLIGIVGTLIAGQSTKVLGLWGLPLIYVTLATTVGGLFLHLWAAPVYAVRFAKVIRVTSAGLRRTLLWMSCTISLSVLLFLVGTAASPLGKSGLLTMLGYAGISMYFAGVAVAEGAPAISAYTRAYGYRGRRWALLVAALGVCTIAAVVGAIAARFLNAQAVWPAITLAVLGIVVTVFVQQQRELHDAIAGLGFALADLYASLTSADRNDDKLRTAAMKVESAITPRASGPLSITPLPLVDEELRTVMYFLLEVVAGLPIRVVPQAQAQFVLEQLCGEEALRTDADVLLAELCWEIRRRLFRSPASLAKLDAAAFVHTQYPRIVAKLAGASVEAPPRETITAPNLNDKGSEVQVDAHSQIAASADTGRPVLGSRQVAGVRTATANAEG